MRPYKTAAFYTLGCKLNFSETSAIGQQMHDAGYAKVDFNESADVYVINTCSVTEYADKKCRNIIRKAKKLNPESFVIVIGCYAQLKPKEISEIKGVNLVLGAQEKFNIVEHLENRDLYETSQFVAGHIKEVKEFYPSFSFGDRTRTFLKVQDGCDYFCSFCTIPLARGRSRNATIEKTLQSAQIAIDKGAKEIVLTGVNIGDFGKSTDETFFDLVKELEKLKGIERFRISSIEPNLLTDEIIKFVSQSKKFVPHFHIPLQSGSDNILEAMRRKYRTNLYSDRVKTIKSLMPNACIGVDVIVGYPGETHEEFLKTYNYLNELDIAYLHVFTYSERPNTVAIRFDNVVPIEDRQQRSSMLRILSEKKKRHFYQSQLGKQVNVLWESTEENGMMHGFSENYLKCKTNFNPDLVNTSTMVSIENIDADGVMTINQLETELI